MVDVGSAIFYRQSGHMAFHLVQNRSWRILMVSAYGPRHCDDLLVGAARPVGRLPECGRLCPSLGFATAMVTFICLA